MTETEPILADIRREFYNKDVVIGEQSYTLIRSVTKKVVSKYPVTVYGNGASTWRDALDDIFHWFLAEVLIAQGQLKPVVLQATTVSDMEAMLTELLKRHLPRTRQKTIVDNLLKRCRDLAEEPPFMTVTMSGKVVLALAGAPRFQEPTRAQLQACMVVAWRMPLVRVRRESDRASMCFETTVLREGLREMLGEARYGLTLRHLDQIFTDRLTSRVPTILYVDVVGDWAPELAGGRDPAENVTARNTAAKVLAALDEQLRTVLRGTLEKKTDEEIGKSLGLERRTIGRMQRRLRAILKQHLEELPGPVADDAFRQVVAVLEASESHE